MPAAIIRLVHVSRDRAFRLVHGSRVLYSVAPASLGSPATLSRADSSA
jgi:hypothetical protein